MIWPTPPPRCPCGQIRKHRASYRRDGWVLATIVFPMLLVEFESIFVVALHCRVLAFFPKQTVARRKHLDIGAHETAKGVFGRPDDRFAAHVEAGVDQHRT